MRHQALTTELLTECFCVFRLGEAEHHEVEVVAAQSVRPLRYRKGLSKTIQTIVVSMAPHFVRGDGDMVEMGEFALASHGIPLSRQSHGAITFHGGNRVRMVEHSIAMHAGSKRALGN